MINKQIMKLLLGKRGVTPQRIYQMIDEKKRQYGYSITKETAAYLVAGDYGIDVSKHLTDEELVKVQRVKAPVVISTPATRTSSRSDAKQIVVELGKDLNVVDPLLPRKLVEDAKEMASAYPVVYIFENSVRNLVSSVMTTKHREIWWDSKVGARIREKVKDRMEKEDKNRWHSRRGAHPIFYTDIDDLKSIITTNWADFEDIFPSDQWVAGKIDEIEMSRNVIAHNNPLEERDITRLNLNLQDWILQISRWTESMSETKKDPEA